MSVEPPVPNSPSPGDANTVPVPVNPPPAADATAADAPTELTGDEPTVPMAAPSPSPSVHAAPSPSLQAAPSPSVQAAPVPSLQAAPSHSSAPAVKSAPARREAGAAEPVEAPKGDKWAARVVVPGATAPGQKKAPAPTAPTQKLARYEDARMTTVAPHPPVPAPTPAYHLRRRTRRSGAKRFFGALVALLLILAVPVVSAYVSYKLASHENPFEWPPTVDLSRVF